MKKHIVILAALWVVLFGTISHGATTSPYGRQVSIDIVPLSFFDHLKWKMFEPTQSVAFEQLLKDATACVTAQCGSPSALDFNRLPFRWLDVIGTVSTDPRSEADLNYTFDSVPNGAPYPRPLRIMRTFFMNSLPQASVLTSGAYATDSYKGIVWVYRTAEYHHEIAFAFGGHPSSVSQADFAEAFRRAFAQKHGVATTSGSFVGSDVSQLRSALLARHGVGCYEPIVTGTAEFSYKLSNTKEWIFRVSSRDHIPERCYRLEFSTDMKNWTELWFSSHLPDATKDFYFAMAGKPKAFYRFSLCWDK